LRRPRTATAAGGRLRVAGERAQLGIRQRGHARLDLRGIDPEGHELSPHLVAGQRRTDCREILRARARLDRLQRADQLGLRDER